MQARQPDYAEGIDVSQWQAKIDWVKVAQDSIVFAYIRATEGVGFTDSQFAANMKGAKNAGILRGPYHYATPSANDAQSEAKYFCDTVEANGGWGEMPPALDLETESGLSSAELEKWVNDFHAYVAKRSGQKKLTYISPNFDRTKLDSLSIDGDLWIAEWGVKAPVDLKNFSAWRFWQYSDKGSVNGISGRVDMDVFYGTPDELKKYCGVDAKASQPKPQKPPESAPKTQSKHDPLLQLEKPYVKSSSVVEVQKIVHAHPIDGIYGPETKKMVMEFQRKEHITVDGVVGPQTWGKIHAVEQSLHEKEIKQGARGHEVKVLQNLLNGYGAQPQLKVDGIFGPKTNHAVREYQAKHHLHVDGIVGPQTWHSLLS